VLNRSPGALASGDRSRAATGHGETQADRILAADRLARMS